ncbi:MAG: Rpn family recombination-promoting nuclease/putative transposase [Saprospiraceae bacterium]
MRKLLKTTQDQLWKGIIEELFVEFLHYFFPDFVDEVDFSKPYEFLDKELNQLIAESETKNRRADLLVKVHLKNKKEKILLIHTEVQGYEDSKFPHRMFQYNYRIYDKFKSPLTAIAILTDSNSNYRPSFYEITTWETTIRYEFKMFKLLDYAPDYFLQSDNPFATVLYIARSHLKKIRNDEDLLNLKLELFRTMLERGQSKRTIREIARFIKLYVSFSKQEFFSKFGKEVDIITNYRKTMGINELYEQLVIEAYKEDWLEEGEEKGIEKGIERGIEKGVEKEKKRQERIIIKKMLSKNLSSEQIADLLDFSITKVETIQQEIQIKSFFKQGLSIKNVLQELEKFDITNINIEDLKQFQLTVKIEKLLTKDVSIDDIATELSIPKTFVEDVQYEFENLVL